MCLANLLIANAVFASSTEEVESETLTLSEPMTRLSEPYEGSFLKRGGMIP